MKITRLVKEDFAATSVAFFCAISVVALLHTKICNALLVVYSLLWFYNRYCCGKKPEMWQYTFIFIFCSYYLLGITGLVHTDNDRAGFHWLEAKMPFLALPVFVSLSPLDEKDINRILNFFSFGVLLIGLVLLLMATRVYDAEKRIDAFTYISLLGPLSLHPSYFSLFASFAIMHLYLQRNIIGQSRFVKTLIFLSIALLVLLNFLALSRAGIFGFVLVAAAFFLFKLVSGKARLVSFWVLLFALIVLVIVTIPLIRERFEAFYVSDPLGAETVNSTAFHIKSWYCAFESLSDYHFFTGYGTGDERDVLVDCYKQHDWQIMINEKHNAHNEYLSIFLRHGVTGLVVFLTMIIYSFWTAIRAGNFVYAGFVVCFSVLCVAGSLNLYHGIVIYCLLNALLFRKSMLTINEKLKTGAVFPDDKKTSIPRV